VGHSETGAVFEQSVQLIFNDTLKLRLRRIVVQLQQPTRDGEVEIALLSNLPMAQADALTIVALYQKRWRIEIRQPQCPHKSEAIDDEAVLALTVFWETLEHSLKALKGIRMGQLQWEVS
jgi:hypothetical protein